MVLVKNSQVVSNTKSARLLSDSKLSFSAKASREIYSPLGLSGHLKI